MTLKKTDHELFLKDRKALIVELPKLFYVMAFVIIIIKPFPDLLENLGKFFGINRF